MSTRDKAQNQISETNETDGDEENNWLGNQCVICFNEFEKGDEIGWSENCDHFFHRDCIFSWLLKHPACPCCRRTFIGMQDKDKEKSLGQVESEDLSVEMGSVSNDRAANGNGLSAAYVAEALDSI